MSTKTVPFDFPFAPSPLRPFGFAQDKPRSGQASLKAGFAQGRAQDRPFSFQTRRENLERMQTTSFDLLVIGGGIVGTGIARDAALRGYRTALVERADFASGTSSKSSKLVHGGLRYLETFDFALVFEASRERRRLLRNAPHLVRPLPFVFPVHRNDPRPLWQIAIGMWLYDGLAMFRNIERHQVWGRARTLREEPVIGPAGLSGATHYYDALTDDARLTLATIVDAHRAGAVIANYARVVGLLRAGERVVGAQVRDEVTEDEIEVRAKVVVNATGPWTDHLLQMATPDDTVRRLHLTKGVHIIVPRQRIWSRAAITLNSPRDGRLMFLIPWGKFSIIGTTDTDCEGGLAEVHADAADVAYILEAVHHAFPVAGLTEADVISTYASLRPLIADGAPTGYKVSREHQILDTAPGFFTIAGGKLTTYRSMAEEMVDEVATYLAREHNLAPPGRCQTVNRPLPGGDIPSARLRRAQSSRSGQALRHGSGQGSGHRADWHTYLVQQVTAVHPSTPLGPRTEPCPEPRRRAVEVTSGDAEVLAHLVSTYGIDYTRVLALADAEARRRQPVISGLPYLWAEVQHALQHEMALTLEDVLGRRTHILDQAPDQGLEVVDQAAAVMAAELGWSAEERAAQVDHYRRVVEGTRRWRSRC